MGSLQKAIQGNSGLPPTGISPMGPFNPDSVMGQVSDQKSFNSNNTGVVDYSVSKILAFILSTCNFYPNFQYWYF